MRAIRLLLAAVAVTAVVAPAASAHACTLVWQDVAHLNGPPVSATVSVPRGMYC